MSELNAFFCPDHIAVIGASSNPAKIGGRRFRTLIEGTFNGDVYPINPRAQTVQGRRAYKSLDDVPGPVDLAIIAVRAELVAEAVSACAQRRVRAVMVITAGFGEQSIEGRALEQSMAGQLKSSGGRLMGPNCAGLFDQSSGMNLSGMAIPAGPIGLVSQSGNVVLDMVLHARDVCTGLSRYASVGNSADIRATDVVENLLDDPSTKVVVGYIEGWGDDEGRRLYNLARTHPSGKPIVLVKPGRSQEGQKAALSHTGSLAGDDRVTDAALRAAGIWRAKSPGEAINVAAALSHYSRLASDRIAILTDGGGHATLLADALGECGLTLANFDPTTIGELAGFLPERCAIANPVDFAGVAEEQPDAIARTIEICRGAKGIGAVALVGHFGGYHDNGGEAIGEQEIAAAQNIASQHEESGAPIFVQSIHANRNKFALEQLKHSGLTVVRSSLELAQVLQALARPPQCNMAAATPWIERQIPLIRLAVETTGSGQAMLEPVAREFLRNHGFAIPRWVTSSDPEKLVGLCRSANLTTVALKLIQPGLVHRTDADGVFLNVAGPAQISAVAKEMLDSARDRGAVDVTVMATAMITSGIELVFGAVRDPHFGPVVMFGIGGIYAEALNDVAFQIAPLNESMAESLISEIQSTRMLFGFRGGPTIDVEAASHLLCCLGDLLHIYPEIDGIDLNPVMLNDEDLAIADVSIILSEAPGADL
ncbi:MAG: acetate--CoA ligase family protein [Hyphomicrobiaceae bacterium]